MLFWLILFLSSSFSLMFLMSLSRSYHGEHYGSVKVVAASCYALAAKDGISIKDDQAAARCD
jgi:hypothetical protein